MYKCHVMARKQGQSVLCAYETHFFTMTLAKKWEIAAFVILVWNMSTLDQNDFLYNNKDKVSEVRITTF